MIAPFPASDVVPDTMVRRKYRRSEHAASWVNALCRGMVARDDVVFRVFVHSRAVTRKIDVEREGIVFSFVPRREPLSSAPYHFYLPGLLALTGPIRRFRPDIVHGFGAEIGNGEIATYLPYPSVVFIQGIVSRSAPYVRYRPLERRIKEFQEHTVIRRADGLVAETRFARDWALTVDPKARVAVIPHALNPEFLETEPTFAHPHILSIGSLGFRKGTDTLLHAMAKCHNPDARLRLVGTGDAAGYRRLAEELGTADRVDFLGRLSRSEIVSELASVRLVVVASRMDTSPNVITEAHAAGLPVVATRAGGIPDMIDHDRDGLLIPVDDADAMTDGFDALLADTGRCRSMGRAGRDKVLTLNDPGRIACKHADLYRTIVKPPTHA